MSAATCRLFLSIISMCELPRMPAYRIVLQQAPVDFRWCRSSNKARGTSGGGSFSANTISCTPTCYSLALIPACLITLAHCGISRSMAAASSAGEPPITSRPRSLSFLRTSGIARIFTVSR